TPPQTPDQISPSADLSSFGAGVLTVRAHLIDVGTLSLSNIGTANFIADGGDIRGNGTLDVTGTITMQAGQIYPTTAAQFIIAAHDYIDGSGRQQSGSVTICISGCLGVGPTEVAQRPLPLSAGGELDVYATVINQGGVLRAPFGVINLGLDPTSAS